MKFERRLLLPIGISDQSRHQVDNEIDHAAMSRVLDLTYVLELIIDRLDQGAFSEEYFVEHRQQLVFHILPDLGDQLHAHLPELGEDFFRDVTAIAEEFAPESPRQAWSRLAIIDVAWSDHHCQQLTAVVDHQMNFEAVEPARAGLAAFSQVTKDLVRVDPQVVTDLDRSRVNERDSCATTKTCEQEGCWRRRSSD